MKANPKKKTTAFYVVFVLFVLYAVSKGLIMREKSSGKEIEIVAEETHENTKAGDIVFTMPSGYTMQHSVDIPLLFAGVLMSVIPVVTLFCVFQKSIMNLSFGGGLKG